MKDHHNEYGERIFRGLIFSSSENDTFYKGVYDRIKNYEFLQIENEPILSGEDFTPEEITKIKLKIKEMDIIICNSYGTIPLCFVDYIKNEIITRNLALVFCRGINDNSGPINMGYTNHSYVDWAYCSSFMLYMENFKKIFTNDILEKFGKLNVKYKNEFELFEKNEKYLNNFRVDDDDETLQQLIKVENYEKLKIELLKRNLKKNYDLQTLQTININGDYFGAIHFDKVINLENDWHILGFGKDDNDVGISILLHKVYKVLFCHYYGFSSGDIEFSKDLTKLEFAYLLFEHGKNRKNKLGDSLFQKINHSQLVDIQLVCNDMDWM
ncbi:hypothetical protein ABK040_000968 [Willaertia magna]